jgi:hypothetical protein
LLVDCGLLQAYLVASVLLGPVHRRVGAVNERACVIVGLIHRDTDVGSDSDGVAVVDVVNVLDAGADSLGDVDRRL